MKRRKFRLAAKLELTIFFTISTNIQKKEEKPDFDVEVDLFDKRAKINKIKAKMHQMRIPDEKGHRSDGKAASIPI